MKHSVFHKRSMLEWLRICTDEGQLMPSDEAIQARFGFASIELARTLLADLADAGEIRIRGAGAARTISFGAVERPALPKVVAAPPVRRVVEPAAAPASRLDMIRAAAARLDARKTVPPVVSVPSPPVVRPPLPQPIKQDPVMAPPVPIVRPVQPGEKRQVSFMATGALLETLVDHATDREIGMGPATVEILLGAMAGGATIAPEPEPEPDGKPHLRAEVLRAWRASGAEFGTFITALIDRGLEAISERTA